MLDGLELDNAEPWKKPTPFDEHSTSDFSKSLPEPLENMAEASAAATQTPLSLNIAAVLAAGAIAVQGKSRYCK
jgi:hypothetical protein